MSRVPTYGSRQVRPSPLPGVAQVGKQAVDDPQSLGAGIGAAVTQVGSVLYAHQQAEADRQDQARVVAAESQVSDWELKAIHGKDGALNQTGVKSFGLPDVVHKSWEDDVGAIREGLSNDRQKAAFDRAIAGRKQSVFRQVDSHVMGQMRAVEKQSNDSYIAGSYQLAIANADDPERVAAEIHNSRVHAGMFAETVGMDSDSTKQYVEAVTSNIHVGVVDRLLSMNRAGMAQDYYDAAKDEVNPVDRSKVERALQIGTVQGQAQATAQKIIGGWISSPSATTLEGGVVTISGGVEKTLQEALDEADKIDANNADKTPLADEVRQRIRRSYSDFKATQGEAQQRAAAATKQIIDDAVAVDKERKAQQSSLIANGIIANHVADASVFDYIDSIAPGQRALMSPQELTMWKSYAKQMSEKGSVSTNLDTYYGLLQLGANDPEAFKAVRLNQYHDVIDAGDLQQLMKDQTAMIKTEAKPPEKFVGFRSTEQIVESAMSARGMVANPEKDTPEWQEKVRAMSVLDKQVTDFVASTGKQPTNEEKQSMMDNLIVTKTIPGWFYGSTDSSSFKPTQKTPPRSMSIGDVPESEQKAIKAELRRQGISASDSIIISVYQKAHGVK